MLKIDVLCSRELAKIAGCRAGQSGQTPRWRRVYAFGAAEARNVLHRDQTVVVYGPVT